MKKNIFIVVWFLTTALSCIYLTSQAQQKYIIKGHISGLTEPMKLIFSYQRTKTETIRDSIIVNDGNILLEGAIIHPYYVSLRLKPINAPSSAQGTSTRQLKMSDVASFYLTGGITTITGSNLSGAVIRNPVQDEYMELKASLKPLEQPLFMIDTKLFSPKYKDSVAVLKAQRSEIEKKYAKANAQFVRTHPNSYVSFDMVKNYAVIISDPAAFEEMYDALAPSFKASAEGQVMAHDLQMVKRLSIGQKAINFTQMDETGKPVSLASLKGKYILIDFWASWCGPCRAEYPYLHKAYAQFKEKGFDIIGVSLDDKKTLWINAIAENKFPWKEVCDLKGKNNEVARAYGISAIPQNFLIDPSGIIVAKDLRGDALLEKLNEVIK